MRVAAHQDGGSRHSRAWPAGLAAACVALVGAGVYFCLSFLEATRGPLNLEGSPLFVSSQVQSPESSADADSAPEADVTPVATAPDPLPLPAGVVPLAPSELLLQAVTEAAGDAREHLAVSVKRVSDGRSATLNGDVQYYAASTFKLAVLYEAALRLSDGRLSLDDRLFMTEADTAEDLGTSGYLEFEDDGSITVANLLQPMIEVSDNSSAVTLLHAFGSGRVDETLRSLGIGTMTVNREELWTTADDAARLMEAIYNGEGVSVEARDLMRSLLLAQTIRGGIPAALEDQLAAGVRIGNKTGTWEAAQHDVAFVEEPSGAYVIAILTDGSYEGWEAMHRVAQSVQQTLANGA